MRTAVSSGTIDPQSDLALIFGFTYIATYHPDDFAKTVRGARYTGLDPFGSIDKTAVPKRPVVRRIPLTTVIL